MSQLAIVFSGLGVATLDIRKKENCHQETDTYPEVDARADWKKVRHCRFEPDLQQRCLVAILCLGSNNLTHVSIRYEEFLKPLL